MRDRMIRQKFWASPSHPEDPWARLLFMAMWNYADDYGVGDCNIRGLLGFAFPNDPDITEARLEVMLRDIGKAYGVVYYTVGRRPYYAIPSWRIHQYVQHPNVKQRNPMPEEAETWLYRDTFTIPDDPHEAFMRASRADHDEVEVERELEIEREVDLRSTRVPARRDAKPKRGCRIPDDYMPSPGVVQAIKAQLGVDDRWLTYHHQKFTDFWRGKSGAAATKLDWDATWRNWMRNEVERNGNRLRAGNVSRGEQKVADWAALGGGE